MKQKQILHDNHYSMYKGVSISHDSQNIPRSMPLPHYHSDFELFYLVKGSRKFFIADTICSLTSESIMLIKPGIPHQSTVSSNIPMERYAIYFSADLVNEILSEFSKTINIENMFFLTLSDVSKKIIYENITKLKNEISTKDNYSPKLIKSIVSEIILLLLREREMSVSLKAKDNYYKNDERMQKVIDYIQANYADNITVEICAKIAYMSPSHFSRQFKRLTATDFKTYLIDTRIKKACKLLKEPNGNNITDIAFKVGFSSCSYFTKSFKKLIGVTPLQYHKKSCSEK